MFYLLFYHGRSIIFVNFTLHSTQDNICIKIFALKNLQLTTVCHIFFLSIYKLVFNIQWSISIFSLRNSLVPLIFMDTQCTKCEYLVYMIMHTIDYTHPKESTGLLHPDI